MKLAISSDSLVENLNSEITQSITGIPMHKTFVKGKTNPARPPDVSTNPIGAAYLVLRTRRMELATGAKPRVSSRWPRRQTVWDQHHQHCPPCLCKITPRVALTPYAFQFNKLLCWANSTDVGPCQTSFNLKRIIKGVPITTPIVLGALNSGT